jgi:tetratricopeptide (TPR) repeat protein
MKPSITRSTRWTVYLAALLYLAFVVYIGVSAANQGLSNYYAEDSYFRGSETEADTAIHWQPCNPNAYESRGMIFLRNREFITAASDFEKAVSLRENDFLLWLRLADARYRSGDIPAARTAYQRSLFLAPNYSEPQYHMGMMLLENGHPETAFQFLSKAAEFEPERYPEILDLARNSFPSDPAAIESSVQPKSIDAKKITARYLINHGLMTESMRSFVSSDQLAEREKNEFISLLIAETDFALARQVWLSKWKIEDAGSNDPIFDGGFERISESDPSGLGWQIDQNATALSVSLDEKEVHSGSRSILVKFAGNVEQDRKLVSQLVYLQPYQKYELRLFFRSTELISAALPVMEVTDGITAEVLARSASFHSTDGRWVEIGTSFKTRSNVVASISLIRPSCNTTPCPIFGDLSLDDFSVAEIRIVPR